MAMYLIGDVQGCDDALQRLLQKIAFSPSRDTLYLLGDLVNRGPSSEGVLRRLIGYGASARCLLGNHDLHLLAVGFGARSVHPKDTISDILNAPDRDALLDWLRHQHMAMLEQIGGKPLLMVHGGVLPQWSADQAVALAQEVETELRSPRAADFFYTMYGNQPGKWDDSLHGADRLRVIVNALTRLRFCSAEGVMEFKSTEGAGHAPEGYMPWFEVPGRKTADVAVAFGHWSTLGWLNRPDVLSLDTGCVWGGCLSALRIDALPAPQGWRSELIQEQCIQAQRPGAN
ncbi:MAG: symmetrical bis(5'-nucleosyl)-tetraphosphatase [Rhodoferax sp.]|nr:symmetrical bis(5'-nucleosyl)-tetraphosphatase [Rhodoferax sp.]